jgi:hypothetical protein
VARIPLPREHGAWAVLLASLLLAWAHPGVVSWPSVVLALLFLLAFAIQEPLRAAVAGRGRSAVAWILLYGAALTAGAAFLIVRYEMWVLIPAGVLGIMLTAVDLLARRHRLHRTAVARLVGIAALTLALPGLLCIIHPDRAAYAFVLWAIVVVYVGSRLPIVRSRILARKGEAFSHKTTVLTEVLLYLAIGALVATRLAPVWIVLAVLPGTIAAFLPVRDMSLQRVGWREVLLLLWFVVAIVGGYHLGGFDTLLT